MDRFIRPLDKELSETNPSEMVQDGLKVLASVINAALNKDGDAIGFTLLIYDKVDHPQMIHAVTNTEKAKLKPVLTKYVKGLK